MKDQAIVLADSISNGHRVVTLQTQSPKFLDAEIEKHGMLATNSSSSRAIPANKTIDNVASDPFIPGDVRYNEPGMQGATGLTYEDEYKFKTLAYCLSVDVSGYAKRMNELGVHKQTINRYLEPFLIQMKVITGNIESFTAMLKLRNNYAADPSVQQWARAIEKAIFNSTPTELKPGEWHLPFSNRIEQSVARVARVSYYRPNLVNSYEKDKALHDKLLSMGHSSCFEHQLTPVGLNSISERPWPEGITHYNRKLEPCSGRMTNWITYRSLIGL